MRILVVGAGSIGSAVGGFMAKAGHDVTLLGLDSKHITTVREKGLRITGIWGEHHVASVRAQSDLAGMHAGDFDLVLISVKSYDTTEAIRGVVSLIDENTLVCSYQNGLGNAEQIADVIGWERVLGARVIFGAWLPEPGCTEVTVIANPTAIGGYDPGPPAARVQQIASAMNDAGIPTIFTDRMASLMWGKIAYNSALNPLSGLLDVPYGVLSETEHTVEIMRGVITEMYAVADALKIPLEPPTPSEYMELLINKLMPPTATHYASLREDFRLKRRTEIDALNGAVCRYGKQCGIECPTNALLTRLVHAREHALGVRY